MKKDFIVGAIVVFILPAIIFILLFNYSNSIQEKEKIIYQNIMDGNFIYVDNYVTEVGRRPAGSHKEYYIVYKINNENLTEFSCSKEEYYNILNKYKY